MWSSSSAPVCPKFAGATRKKLNLLNHLREIRFPKVSMSLAAPMFTNHPNCDSLRSSPAANCVSSREKSDVRES
jgi:hypothetical protein